MPPAWLPFAALGLIVAASALRVLAVEANHKVKVLGFGRRASVQGVAERTWRIAVLAALVLALMAWLAPQWEILLGQPEWAGGRTLRWVAATLFAVATALIIAAQIQMGASWRIGVPKEGPGDLVTGGLFAWSRNPIFLGILGAALALFLWSPHIATAALMAATWTLTQIQVRIEEEALREKHGDAYERYAARAGRWFGRRRMAAR